MGNSLPSAAHLLLVNASASRGGKGSGILWARRSHAVKRSCACSWPPRLPRLAALALGWALLGEGSPSLDHGGGPGACGERLGICRCCLYLGGSRCRWLAVAVVKVALAHGLANRQRHPGGELKGPSIQIRCLAGQGIAECPCDPRLPPNPGAWRWRSASERRALPTIFHAPLVPGHILEGCSTRPTSAINAARHLCHFATVAWNALLAGGPERRPFWLEELGPVIPVSQPSR